MKKYTKVTFILLEDTITKYFEGRAKLNEIHNFIGFCKIVDIKIIYGNFEPDYKKAKNLYGYTGEEIEFNNI